MIKNFAIFKNTKATGNQPGYDMVGKDEQENKLRLASIWLKDHNGTKFYSGQMKDEFTKEDGTKYPGFCIITDEEYAEYQALKNAGTQKADEQADENYDAIPF